MFLRMCLLLPLASLITAYGEDAAELPATNDKAFVKTCLPSKPEALKRCSIFIGCPPDSTPDATGNYDWRVSIWDFECVSGEKQRYEMRPPNEVWKHPVNGKPAVIHEPFALPNPNGYGGHEYWLKIEWADRKMAAVFLFTVPSTERHWSCLPWDEACGLKDGLRGCCRYYFDCDMQGLSPIVL